MGNAGCAAYLFERKGLFTVEASTTDEDTLMSIALDAGADDLKRSGSIFEITCDPTKFNEVQDSLKKAGVNLGDADLSQIAKAPVEVDTETGKKIVKLMDALDDHDDVQHVYSTANVTEEMVMTE